MIQALPTLLLSLIEAIVSIIVELTVTVVAKNPPSIVILAGLVLTLLGNPAGVPLMWGGVGLNALWVFGRYFM